jgi:predicted permease
VNVIGTVQRCLDTGFGWLARCAPSGQAALRDDDAVATYHAACAAAYEKDGLTGLMWEGIAGWINVAVCAVQIRIGGSAARRGRLEPATQPAGRGGPRMIDDLRHAWRRLRSRPAGALLAIGTLALAIGITAAMATVVDALILRPMPFRDVASLAWLSIGKPGDTSVYMPVADARAARASGAFDAVFVAYQESASFGDGDNARSFAGAWISPGFFEDLGVRPILGRTFITGEGRAGTDTVVVVSESVWRSQLGADPNVVGTRVRISGAPVLLVGVMPARFHFPFPSTLVWRAFDIDDPPPPVNPRRPTNVYTYVRQRHGLQPDDAGRRAMEAIRAVDPRQPDEILKAGPIPTGLNEYSTGTVRALAAGVGLVFFVLCANVANLMLTRLDARRREFGTCSALGASRARLLRQALFEQVLVAIAASIVGVAAAAGLIALANAYLPSDIVKSTLNPLAIDFRVVLATSLCGLLAVVIAGLVPAWIGTRQDLALGIRMASAATTDSRASKRMSSAFLVGEIALAVALAVAAGLQLRSFVNLLEVDQGFALDKLVSFRVGFPPRAFSDSAQRYVVAENLRTALQRLPGVEGVTISAGVPSVDGNGIYFYDVQPDTEGAAPVHIVWQAYNVAPEFFDVMGITLLQGRGFQKGDGPDVVVISQSMASQLWPGSTSVPGHTLSFGKQTLQVVGVSNEIRNPLQDPREDRPEFYQPLFTAAANGDSLDAQSVSLTVRCSVGCPTIDAMRREIATTSAAVNLRTAQRLADAYVESLARPRTGAVVTIAFAVIGLLTVAGGLFAVLTRVVLRRQREFGIRLALGATPREVGRLVERSSWGLGAIGLAVGVGLAWIVARVLAAVQYQVAFADPMIWAAVLVAMTLTILAASWLPARRATKIDPLDLIRDQQ